MRPRTGLIAGIIAGAAAIVLVVLLVVVQPWAAPEGPTVTTESDAAQTTAPASLSAIDETTQLLSDAGEGAPVVVEFLDFECPTCGAVYPTMDALVEEYGDEVTFAVRYLPIQSHANAVTSALAAEAAAQQGAFAEMLALLFERQDEWAGVTTSQADVFRGYAEELGLDMEAYDAAIADPETLARVQLDVDAAIALGVDSTPTIFIDDERLDLQDIGDIEAGIQAALED